MPADSPTTTASLRRWPTSRTLLLIGVGIFSAATAAGAAPAAAHVEPTVTTVPAGSEAEIDFIVQHGCDESPTTKLEFQVPEPITDATPLAKPGWTSTVDGQVITFTGGPLPADEEDAFAVRFSVPNTPGATLVFPFLQTCQEGSIDWIQLDPDGERPAPVVEIGPADPTAPSTTAPAPPATGTEEPPTTTTATGTDGTSITLEAATTVPAGSTAEAEPTDAAADSTNSGLIGALGVLLVTVVGVGVVIARRGREG